MTGLLRRTATRAGLAAMLGATMVWGAPAQAQTKYPAYPIRVMLPFAAGSVSDVTLRVVAERLGARLGTSVVIENMPRAGGITAATTALAANPDGYTLIVLSSSTAISVSLLKSMPYDPIRDFAPVSGVSTFANIVATGADSPYRSYADLAAAAKAKPGSLNIGTTTVGSTNHLAANLWKSMTGLDFVIVPFRTPADMMTAAIRNDVAAVIQSYGFLKSSLADKRLRALASTTPTRASYAPDVPTLDEAGVKGFDVVTWNGLFAPAKTPPDVVALLNKELRATLDDPDLKARFLELGLEPLPTTQAALGERMRSEVGKWAQVIKSAGIAPE
jgi:tripartite-type tricarboxylate transporter receptor subunit TctC